MKELVAVCLYCSFASNRVHFDPVKKAFADFIFSVSHHGLVHACRPQRQRRRRDLGDPMINCREMKGVKVTLKDRLGRLTLANGLKGHAPDAAMLPGANNL